MSNDMNEPEKLNFIKEKETFINKPVEPKKKKEKFDGKENFTADEKRKQNIGKNQKKRIKKIKILV